MEAGRVVDRCDVDQDQVGALAGRQRADQSPMCSARAPSRVAMASVCTAGRAVGSLLRLGHERGQAQLFEHVEVVVGGRAIRADAHGQPGLEHLFDRREAGSELEVRGRIVATPAL